MESRVEHRILRVIHLLDIKGHEVKPTATRQLTAVLNSNERATQFARRIAAERTKKRRRDATRRDARWTRAT